MPEAPDAAGVAREPSPDPRVDNAAFAASRKGSLGGSDIAVLLGLSPFKSPLQLYLEKRGEIEDEDLSENEAVTLGNELELVILARYARRNRCEVVSLTGTRYRDKALPWRTASIDGYVAGTRRGIEAKTAGLISGRASEEWGEGPDEYPVAYGAQVRWYLSFGLFDDMALAALVAGFGYMEKIIERDLEIEEGMLYQAGAFWADVLAGRPPAPRTIEDAKLLWPVSKAETSVQASDEMIALDREMRILEAKEKEVADSIEAIEIQMKAFLGPNEVMLAGKQKLRSWKSQDDARIDVARFRAEQAALAAQYTVLSSKRVFRKHEPSKAKARK